MNIKRLAAVAALLTVFAASAYSPAMAQTAPGTPIVVTTDVPDGGSRHGDSGRDDPRGLCRGLPC